jgi:hypothetical protein
MVQAAAVTGAACILLPLLLAAAYRWLPPSRWLVPAVAALTAVLAASLPWTGDSFAGWLLTDPLAVHVTILCAFAWLIASTVTAMDTSDVAQDMAAAVVGCINLALLSNGAGLTLAAAGAAAIAACHMLRGGVLASLVTTVACGLGVAGLGLAILGSGTGWPSLGWSTLPIAGSRTDGLALGVAFVALLVGLGSACTALPVWAALRRTALMLSGPLAGVWLVMVLRLRGLLDGSSQAMAPGGPMVALGLAGLVVAALCLRGPDRLLPAAIVAMLSASLLGIGMGGAAATQAGLLHFTLGCLALTAAATGSWPATLGTASLAALPPLGLFASGFALLTAAFARTPLLAVALGMLLAIVAVAGLRLLAPPGPDGPAARIGWIGLALSLLGGWAMPAGTTAWLQGIAAAAP